MENKKSPGQTSYQRRGSNDVIWFGRGSGNKYVRGQDYGFNLTKLKVRGKCEALGSDAYSILDARQADNYTKNDVSDPKLNQR